MKRNVVILGACLFLLGVGVPLWHLALLGLLVVSVTFPLFAVALGVVADLVFGTPPGYSVLFSMPFTLTAFIAAALRVVAGSYLRTSKV